jgi:prepilin peptidase CpaA
MTTGSLLPIGLVPVVVLVIGVTACVTDVRSRKIPNILTFGAAACGVLFHVMVHGSAGLLLSAGGWATGVLLFLPFFLLRGMGAGDVKLLAALGSWLGPLQTLWLALFASMAGGVLALAVALSSGYLRKMFQNIGSMLLFWYVAGPKPVPEQTLDRSTSPRLAYAIPIFVGAVITLWRH